jgi:DNA-binding CsgD family transcriptional regulator
LLRLSPIELTILQETDEAGLNCGLSIPMYRSRSRIAILCFASSTENLFNAEATLGRLITIGAQFQAALEFSDQTLRQPRTLQRLSSREIECLNWTGRGKSSWEVAKILHISEATVNFHLKNIMKRLGAINRTAALAAAISLDLIDARTVTFTRKQAECAGGRDVNGTGHRLHARSQWSVRRDGSGRRTTKGADDQRAARCASFQQDSQPFANQGAKPDHE